LSEPDGFTSASASSVAVITVSGFRTPEPSGVMTSSLDGWVRAPALTAVSACPSGTSVPDCRAAYGSRSAKARSATIVNAHGPLPAVAWVTASGRTNEVTVELLAIASVLPARTWKRSPFSTHDRTRLMMRPCTSSTVTLTGPPRLAPIWMSSTVVSPPSWISSPVWKLRYAALPRPMVAIRSPRRSSRPAGAGWAAAPSANATATVPLTLVSEAVSPWDAGEPSASGASAANSTQATAQSATARHDKDHRAPATFPPSPHAPAGRKPGYGSLQVGQRLIGAGLQVKPIEAGQPAC
jgi:hypothetical protein